MINNNNKDIKLKKNEIKDDDEANNKQFGDIGGYIFDDEYIITEGKNLFICLFYY